MNDQSQHADLQRAKIAERITRDFASQALTELTRLTTIARECLSRTDDTFNAADVSQLRAASDTFETAAQDHAKAYTRLVELQR
jgi:hypothetical protein